MICYDCKKEDYSTVLSLSWPIKQQRQQDQEQEQEQQWQAAAEAKRSTTLVIQKPMIVIILEQSDVCTSWEK